MIETTIKAAIDTGDLNRATALIEVLRRTPKAAPALVLERSRGETLKPSSRFDIPRW